MAKTPVVVKTDPKPQGQRKPAVIQDDDDDAGVAAVSPDDEEVALAEAAEADEGDGDSGQDDNQGGDDDQGEGDQGGDDDSDAGRMVPVSVVTKLRRDLRDARKTIGQQGEALAGAGKVISRTAQDAKNAKAKVPTFDQVILGLTKQKVALQGKKDRGDIEDEAYENQLAELEFRIGAVRDQKLAAAARKIFQDEFAKVPKPQDAEAVKATKNIERNYPVLQHCTDDEVNGLVKPAMARLKDHGYTPVPGGDPEFDVLLREEVAKLAHTLYSHRLEEDDLQEDGDEDDEPPARQQQKPPARTQGQRSNGKLSRDAQARKDAIENQRRHPMNTSTKNAKSKSSEEDLTEDDLLNMTEEELLTLNPKTLERIENGRRH